VRTASRYLHSDVPSWSVSTHTAASLLAAGQARPREVGTTAYATKQERVTIAGLDDLLIRSLLDRSQFDDPHGDAERLGISSAAWPLFGMLWPSGVHLAARMGQRPVSASERILEVGCGLALASLVGHRRGADVTASDRHPLAETFLLENLRANRLAPLKYRHGNWAPPRAGAVVVPVVTGLYDLIIGSDLLYERDANANLVRFITRHASPAAEIWIVDPDRANRSAFNRHMRVHGFACQEERLHTPAAPGVGAYKGRMLTYVRSG
jgi:predicted nicotinamide N-methyase